MPVELSKPYCTLNEVQDECRQHATEADVVDKISTAINRASRAIDEMCSRDFWFHDHTSSALPVSRRQVVGASIFLPWPILTLTEIKENGFVVQANNYNFEAGTRQIEKVSTMLLGQIQGDPLQSAAYDEEPRWMMPGGGNTITLAGTFGYALADTDPTKNPPPAMPSRVRRACVLIASAWSGENRKEQVSPDGQKVNVLDVRIPPEAKTLLSKYVREFL